MVNFFLRTVPVSVEQLGSLEDAIRLTFIPAISGRSALSDKERDILSLPTRLGGLESPIRELERRDQEKQNHHTSHNRTHHQERSHIHGRDEGNPATSSKRTKDNKDKKSKKRLTNSYIP